MFSKASLIFFICYCILSLRVSAQQAITLVNPSFEDMPRKGGEPTIPIRGWHDCGLSKFPGESPPDIHPVPGVAWEVSKDAYDGETFLGMVTRYNDTYESLSQALGSPIQGGVCYSFSAFIARSDQYKSGTTRSSQTLENFVRPAVLLIWGGNSFCDKAELLGESPAVSNSEWKFYKFLFQPQKTHKYITIEAFYKTPILEGYNGHILLDAFSNISPVDCPLIPQDIIAEVSDPPSKMEVISNTTTSQTSSSKTTKGGSSTTTSSGTISTPVRTFTPVLLPQLVQSKMFVGQKIRLTDLYFKADSINLEPQSYKVLNELADYLKTYPKTTIEIGGHTNTVPTEIYCNELSTARAKSVKEYLISQGISETRLKYKGYGKSSPLIKYDAYNKEARLKNQRVEIKILSLS
jgi:outer membrane protein OmpA-like peptidoglycan-associated protein